MTGEYTLRRKDGTLVPIEYAAQEALRRLLVAPFLHQDVQYQAVTVDGPPPPALLPLDLQLHFIEVPCVSCPGAATAEFDGEGRPELLAPQPDGLIAHLHPTFRQQLLHVPVTQGEPIGGPDGVADDRRGKPVASV
jgi:hypothetical protein